MIYRMELTYHEIVLIWDVKYFTGSTIEYTLPPVTHEISDINLMLMSLLLDDVKVDITVDDIRVRSFLTTNKTIKILAKCFSTQYYSIPFRTIK